MPLEPRLELCQCVTSPITTIGIMSVRDFTNQIQIYARGFYYLILKSTMLILKHKRFSVFWLKNSCVWKYRLTFD